MARGIKNHELACLRLEVVLADIDGNTSLPLFLFLVQQVCELETCLAICLAELFDLMHLLLVNAAHLQQQMAHQSALA